MMPLVVLRLLRFLIPTVRKTHGPRHLGHARYHATRLDITLKQGDLSATWVLGSQTGRGDDIAETLNDARKGEWLERKISIVPAKASQYKWVPNRGVVFHIAEDDRITQVGPGHDTEARADPEESDK